MTKKKKIIIIAVVVLLGGGYVAKGFVMPPPKNTDKIKGTLYLMPKEFLVNLSDGRYGKIDVALLLAPGQSNGATAEAASGNSGDGRHAPGGGDDPGPDREHPDQPEQRRTDRRRPAREAQTQDPGDDSQHDRCEGARTCCSPTSPSNREARR